MNIAGPRISVVIPTYNRADLLRGTLEALTAQRMPAGTVEVIVADDGSSDGTRDVVQDFTRRLRLRYHFQPDRGFRAAAARNAGARLASAPVLVFADSGILPGPDFLSSHLEAHAAGSAAVIGYTFGYRPGDPTPGLAAALRTTPVAEVVRRYGDAATFLDIRHRAFERFAFDLDRTIVPWQWFWSLNCSVPADAFRAVGGFDESFRSWGGEDLELGFRLFRHGLRFQVNRDAWAVDVPHPRSADVDQASNLMNLLTFLRRHPEPVVELLFSWFAREQRGFQINHQWNVEDEYRALNAATVEARRRSVVDELDQEVAMLGDATRIAVLGCGPEVPDRLAGAVLFDFDPQVVNGIAGRGRRVGHAVGLHTLLPDKAVDLVIVTSRLSGLWERWQREIRAEAHRIGHTVRTHVPG
ncbi:glycosyltransferase family 2 protein [Micromonospora sp. NPDC051925]|uniref:glycosyltransferase family 2 protein n=1 Tax=Micromonospora sp. NPDC051925 TaxID=3364288 RepID=UPI0037C6975C